METSSVRYAAALSAVRAILGGYESGFEILHGHHPDAIERFVVLSVRGSPRLLLPPERAVMRAAITGFLGNRRFVGMVTPLVQFAVWAGGSLSKVDPNVSLVSRDGAPSPLRSLIAEVVGRDDFNLALRLSLNRPNAKTVAMALSDSGEALCFAKFGSEAMTDALVAHESATLERFEGADMPVIMPRRLYSGTWADGHNVLITAPLELGTLSRDAGDVHRVADAFASRSFVARSTLRESEYWRRIGERIAELEDGADRDETLRAALSDIERVWGEREFDFGASHGDWTRANLGLIEGRVAALDWERCTELAPRGIDVAHFVLCESSFPSFGKALDCERAADVVRRHLDATGLPTEDAEALVVLALLEMVIRFESARSAGLRSIDSKFNPALQRGLRRWAA